MLVLDPLPRPRDPYGAVRMRFEGPPPHGGTRLFLTLFLLPFFVAPGVAFVAMWEGAAGLHFFAIPFFAVWYLMLFGMVWFMGHMLGHWSLVEWDRATQCFTARFARWCMWGRRTRRIPFAEIESVHFEIGAEGAGAPGILCRITQQDERGRRRPFMLGLTVPQLGGRDAALELAFAVARLLGWKGYVVERHDDLKLVVALVAREAGGRDVRPVPEHGESADVDAHVPDAAEMIPPFEPERLSADLAVMEWSPGRLVRLAKLPTPKRKLIPVAIFGAIISGLPLVAIAGMLLMQTAGQPWTVLLLVVPAVEVPIFVAIVVGLAAYQARREREVVVDWRAGHLALRADTRVEQVPLREVRELVVTGRSRTVQESHDDHTTTRTLYWCVLSARVGDRDCVLVETETAASTDTPYLGLVPMAAELGRALEVPWRWEGFR